jgi:hypothetical protein
MMPERVRASVGVDSPLYLYDARSARDRTSILGYAGDAEAQRRLSGATVRDKFAGPPFAALPALILA